MKLNSMKFCNLLQNYTSFRSFDPLQVFNPFKFPKNPAVAIAQIAYQFEDLEIIFDSPSVTAVISDKVTFWSV